MEDEEQVMSEVHLGCPPNQSGQHISRFTISIPQRGEGISRGLDDASDVSYDEDGDLVLVRRSGGTPKDSLVVRIQHNITSSLPRVGLQVWRAELVLADFVLHNMTSSSDFDGIVAVELGCGLLGMILAIGANTIFLTDHGDEVLGNCDRNVHLNSEIFHPKASIHVRELDWKTPWPPVDTLNSQSQKSYKYDWSAAELEELEKAPLFFAADVIYSDDLTDAFFSLLESIMSTPPEKVLYLALEKRYNFSMDDLDVVANGYSHLLSFIQHEQQEEEDGFIGRLVNLDDIPQYLQRYERGNDVEIWEIRYVKQNG